MRRHGKTSFYYNQSELPKTLPMIMAGDFNSLPISSVLSAFMFEDTEYTLSSWQIPKALS